MVPLLIELYFIYNLIMIHLNIIKMAKKYMMTEKMTFNNMAVKKMTMKKMTMKKKTIKKVILNKTSMNLLSKSSKLKMIPSKKQLNLFSN